MKRSTILKSIVLLLFIIPSFICFSQDSSRIIILSKDIGPIVDLNEKLEFNILPIFKENFVSAMFYLSADSLYKCKVNIRKDGTITDTTLILNYNSIKNIVMRVQYLESIKKGYSSFNMKNVKLFFANNEEVENIIKMEKKNIANIEKAKPKLYKFKIVKELPLNRKNIDYAELIESENYFGISFGIMYNSEKFNGLNKIFNLLEENIPEPGYKINRSNLTFNSFPTFTFSSFLIIDKNFMVELKYGFNISEIPGDKSDHLSYITFLGSLGYLKPILKNTSLYGAVGFTGIDFDVMNYYNADINNNSGVLKSIKLKGRALGIKLSLGIKLNLSSWFILDLTVSQNFYNNLKINNIQDYQIKYTPEMNIDSYDIGISFSVTNN